MRKNINRTTLVVLVSLLMMLSGSFFLFPTNAAPVPKTSQVTLTIAITSEQYDAVDDVIAGFLASPLAGEVTDVDVVSSGDTADAQLTYFQTQLAGEDPTIDVIGMDVIWTALFSENGWIENLDTYLDTNEMDDYIGGMVDSCTYKGSVWAYPYFFNLGVLFYRKDLLTTYGYSESDFDTWAELNATANDILAQENDPDLVGYVGQFSNYEGGTVNFQEWIGSNGATDIFDSSGDPNLTNPDIINALAFLKGLIAPADDTDLRTTDYIIDRDALGYTEGESEAKWSLGEAIFCRQWPYVYSITIANPLLNNTMGPPDNYTQFGITEIPTFTGGVDEKSSCVGGAILGISAFSDAKDAAFNLTRYLGDNESQYYALEEYSHFPALKDTYSGLPSTLDYVEQFYLVSGRTLARPKHEDYPEISDAISDRFTEVISCQKSAADGMDDLQQDIEDIISPPSEVVIPSFVLSIVFIGIAAMVSVIVLLNRKKFKH
ncbi:MAG: extracellular solute-binding protein [Candidatus Thorarchaeota archaeon]